MVTLIFVTGVVTPVTTLSGESLAIDTILNLLSPFTFSNLFNLMIIEKFRTIYISDS
jgi:hypothetical protein